MALGNLGTSIKNDAKGLVGNIEKAVLFFPDQVEGVTLNEPEAVEAFGRSLGMDAKTIRKRSLEMQLSKAKLKTVSANSVTTTYVMKNMDQDLSKMKGKTFKVQFNPSTIQINARGGGRSLVSNYGAKGENQRTTIQYRPLDPYITVSFSIFFDKLNNADAFMEERLTLGVTTLGKNIATAAVGMEYTVKPQVEGFLAAIRNEAHRAMIFQWGSLRYMGLLNSVSSRYTMFNTAGNPIRAEVQLGMLMGGAPADSFDGSGYLDYWKKRYSDILKKNAGENTESMTTGTVKNQFTNLLNL